MIGRFLRLVLIASLLGFGFLAVYRRQALRKMDAAVAAADDALRKYEAVHKQTKRRAGRAAEAVETADREMDEARKVRDDLADKRERMKRFF